MEVNYSWLVGVVLAALGSFVSNLGVTLQKLHHIQSAKSSSSSSSSTAESSRGDYYKQALWRVGLALVVVGSVADFAALSFAPQSLVAPLGSLTLVSNVIFAPLLLKEKITTRDLIATVTIVSGSTIAVAFASHDDVIYGMADLFSFYFRLPFLAYISAVLVYIGALFGFVRHMQRLEIDLKVRPSLRHTDARYIGYDRLRHLLRFAYPSISGAIGAQSVLFAKCTAELLTNTTQGNGFLFAHHQTYLVLMGMGTTVFLQIKWLNEGLMRFSASYTVPVFMAFWIVLSVMSGMVFYNEYVGMDSVQMSMFAFGVAMTVAGVVTLSKKAVDERRDPKLAPSSETPAIDDDMSRDIDPILVANIGKALAAVEPNRSCSPSLPNDAVMNISVAVDSHTGRLLAKVSAPSHSHSHSHSHSSHPHSLSHPIPPSSPSLSSCSPAPLPLPILSIPSVTSSSTTPSSLVPSSSSSVETVSVSPPDRTPI